MEESGEGQMMEEKYRENIRIKRKTKSIVRRRDETSEIELQKRGKVRRKEKR